MVRKLGILWLAGALLGAWACGSSDGKKKVADAHAGEGGGEAAPSTAGAGQAAVADTGGEGGVGAGLVEGGAGGALTAQGGATAGASEGGMGGAGPLLDAEYLFATLNGMLVRIDVDTAELTEIGLVRNAADEAVTYPDLCLTHSGTGSTAYATIGYYQNSTVFATVDLCTGLTTLGPALTRAATTTLVVEGLAVAPDGTVYVASGDSATTFSTNLGTLDIETGVITNLGGAVSSVENDIDHLFFADDVLHGVDVAISALTFDVFSFNLTTGATAPVTTPTFAAQNQVPMRVSYAPLHQKAVSWRLSDRTLFDFDLTEGGMTPIAATHAAGLYGSQPVHAYFVAPTPECE